MLSGREKAQVDLRTFSPEFVKEGQPDQTHCGTDLACYLLIYPKNEKHMAFLGLLRIHKYSPDGISGQAGIAGDPGCLK